jgi:hypothetical protein
MSYLHDAIYALNPTVVSIREEIALDINGNEVSYDKSAAQTKATELQSAETAKETAQATAKASAIAKLNALGLTQDEVKALIG